MQTQNNPSPRPDVDQILSAIAHLQLAAEALDTQRLHINHIPPERRKRIERRLDDAHHEAFELYDTACTLLAQILRPDLIPEEQQTGL
ncbi:MAG: hypothetical protein IKN60_04725 [Bacteroidales bacterium]|nr:hypothetical protein [Bacteroidales bacterium]